jgi:hypothetical protein
MADLGNCSIISIKSRSFRCSVFVSYTLTEHQRIIFSVISHVICSYASYTLFFCNVKGSKRELVKSDAYKDTYSLVDKRYMGSFSGPERFYWDTASELYRRSGGNMDSVDSFVRGDGAAFIHGFEEKYAPRSRYVLDHHHLCEKPKQRIYPLYDSKSRRNEVMDTILEYLESDHVGDALDYIWGLRKRFRKRYKRKHLQKLAEYPA